MGTKGTIKAIQVFDAMSPGNVPVERSLWLDPVPDHCEQQIRQDQRDFTVWIWDGEGQHYEVRIMHPIVVTSEDIIEVTGFVRTNPNDLTSPYHHWRFYFYLTPPVVS